MESAPEPPRADDVEMEFWDTIKHSSSALEYEVYLERYPDGAFAPLAEARLAGPDPKRTSYGSFFSFSDPDGNTWLVQEVTTRHPGRI